MFALRTFAFAVIAAVTSMAGFADLAKQNAEWPSTAVQWLMTRDEQRAWRGVKTDEQARAFIDLFWARRDPTPGTALNEFRSTFEARVRFADENFKTRRKRGSLTDQGRVFILLGPPKNALLKLKDLTGGDPFGGGPVAAAAASGGSPGGGPAPIQSPGGPMPARTLAAKTTFEYERPGELGLSGPVVFIESPTTEEFKIDPQQSNVMGALADAVRKAIVSPNLKEVPEWASTAPRAVVSAPPLESAPAESVAPAPAPAARKATATPAVPVVVAGAPGAHDLMLLANVRVIKVGEDSNPFARVEKKWSFRKSDDLGFAFQYCTATVSSPRPKLTMSITMSGKVRGEPVSVSTPEDEVVAEPITALPGCYLVRGAVPLESLESGSYGFFVNVKDADGKTATIEKGFTVE